MKRSIQKIVVLAMAGFAFTATPYASAESEEPKPKSSFRGNNFIDSEGYIRQAIVCGSFEIEDRNQAYFSECPEKNPRPHGTTKDRQWSRLSLERNEIFNFRTIPLDGMRADAYVLLSLWVKIPETFKDKPISLRDLEFTLEYIADDGVQVWLNGTLIHTNNREGPLLDKSVPVDLASMRVGWNNLLVQVVQAGGEWLFSGRFAAKDNDFYPVLKFAVKKSDSD